MGAPAQLSVSTEATMAVRAGGGEHILSSPDGPAVLEVLGLSAHAPDGTQLLDDVTFCVPRGSLIGIAGPTGAGKSSLLRVLTGSLPATSGRVLVRGADLGDDPHLRRRIGFVPQENVLHKQLRLRRALNYGAALRLPPEVPAADRRRRVRALLDELGLARHSSVSIGSLSGGQRQRANVAMEMIGDPDILILDEPTSSLDPGYEKTVLETLRGLAARGHAVLTVTHSMPALMDCDRVLFLAAGGQQAYFGPPLEALAYFGRESPPDLFGDLDDVADRQWGRRFRASRDFRRYALAASVVAPPIASGARPVPSGIGQLPTLIKRGAEQIASDRRHTAMLAVQGAVLGLLLLTFLGADGLRPVRGHPLAAAQLAAASGVAQLLALTVVWLGLANSVREVVKERRMIEREHSAGLSLGAYLASKFLVLGSISVVEAAVLAVIATARQSPPARGAVLGSGTLELMVTLAAAGLASTALGLLVSAAVRSPDKALAGLPVVVVTEFVLSGLQPAVRWFPGLDHLHDLASSYWAIQGVQATVTGDSHAWWTALAALAVTAGFAGAAGSALLRRGFRPSRRPRGITRRQVAVVWGRWSESMVASRAAMRAASAGLLLMVAAGSVLANGLEASPSRAALPGSAAPVGHSARPVGAASAIRPSPDVPGPAAQATNSSASPGPSVPAGTVPPAGGLPPASGGTPATARTVSEATPGGQATTAPPSTEPPPAPTAEPPGTQDGTLVTLPIAASPARPVVATPPAPVSASPVTPGPVSAVPVPLTTPTTTPVAGPTPGPVGYPPLVAAEQAMAEAMAQAWAARMQTVLHGIVPVYGPTAAAATAN